MTPEQAGQVLAYCVEAWPAMTIGNDTALVWADALRNIDAQDAHDAVRRLVTTDERPPSIARVTAAARGIARGHDETHALPMARNRGQAAEAMKALNVLMAQFPRPDHDHRQGIDACPACSTRDDRMSRYVDAAADLLADYGIETDRRKPA